MAKKIWKKEIRLSGSGGQGLITAGIILAKAAILDGNHVTQAQSYGPESRGGASRADVVISNSDIYFPEAQIFDVFLALTQEACDKYIYDMKEKGIFIGDDSLIKNVSLITDNGYLLPFVTTSEEKLGSSLPSNIMALAFLVKKSKVVTQKALKQAVTNAIKPAYIDMNIKAIKLGFELADKYEVGNL
ncbi:MAG: 2-oxoacid:acceptor oxidoreductase family protein [Candidatus Cloacimonadota bacterium]|nr:2-oxoacid:acceptor oxidoreductase family protein [Candidatus Cloacimonadota bacterium]